MIPFIRWLSIFDKLLCIVKYKLSISHFVRLNLYYCRQLLPTTFIMKFVSVNEFKSLTYVDLMGLLVITLSCFLHLNLLTVKRLTCYHFRTLSWFYFTFSWFLFIYLFIVFQFNIFAEFEIELLGSEGIVNKEDSKFWRVWSWCGWEKGFWTIWHFGYWKTIIEGIDM